VQTKDRARKESSQLSFWLILAMAIPAAISTTVLASLLPTVLNELGFDLTFGGFSTTMFGLGGAIGSFVWADIAHKKGEFKCIVASLLLVIPFLVAYLMLIDNKMAIWMLFGAGFFAVSAYILMITLSRQATGLTLGHRMGFMVGGTWAVAGVFFMALSPVMEYFGTDVILRFSPLGYLCSGTFGLLVMLKAQSSARAKLSAR
jgi:MFS family permease